MKQRVPEAVSQSCLGKRRLDGSSSALGCEIALTIISDISNKWCDMVSGSAVRAPSAVAAVFAKLRLARTSMPADYNLGGTPFARLQIKPSLAKDHAIRCQLR